MKLLNRLPAALLLLPPLLLCPALDPAIAQQVEAPDVRIDAQIQINLALCGTLSTDRTLTPAPEPYVLCRSGANVTGGATLTIEPGVTVVAEPSAVLRVRSDGALRAVGSEAAPIRLVGADPTPGSWTGVWIESGTDVNELAWVEIAYGGTSNYANLQLSQSARSRISNSTFREAGTWGLHAAGASVSLPDFRSNRFHGNTIAPMRIFPQQMQWIDSETGFAGNGQDVIVVRGGTLSGEGQVWGRTSVPFLLANYINVSTRLDVEPGFRLLAADGASIVRIRTDGSIRAIGTAALPIRFTAESEQPGAWSGLWIESDAGNVLRFVEIAYGGRGSYHNIHLGSGASVTVENSIIRDSASFGINAGSRTARLSESGNYFRDNASGDIRSDREVLMLGGIPPFEPAGIAEALARIRIPAAQGPDAGDLVLPEIDTSRLGLPTVDPREPLPVAEPEPDTEADDRPVAVVISTPPLTMTGIRFEPMTLTTPEVTMTGIRFEPMTLTTPELTMTGIRE